MEHLLDVVEASRQRLRVMAALNDIQEQLNALEPPGAGVKAKMIEAQMANLGKIKRDIDGMDVGVDECLQTGTAFKSIVDRRRRRSVANPIV